MFRRKLLRDPEARTGANVSQSLMPDTKIVVEGTESKLHEQLVEHNKNDRMLSSRSPLPNEPPMKQTKRLRYFMLKPPAEVAAHIWHLPRAQRSRPPGLLHLTLLPLFDLASVSPQVLPFLLAIMQNFCAEAFDAVFDRVEAWRYVVLRGDRALALDVRALQRALACHLADSGFLMFGGSQAPHVTISYRGDGQGCARIGPIGWRADHLLLIESVVGQTRHVEHGRWPLA